MDCEYFLSCMYTSMNAIENLTDIIYKKINDGWHLNCPREEFDEMLSLNYSIQLHAKYLKQLRTEAIDNIYKGRS